MAAAAACQLWQPGMFSWWTIGVCTGLALLGEIIEFAAGAVGASRAGGSKTGAAGAIVGTLIGAVIGTFIPPPVIGTILAFLQLSETTRNFLNRINVSALIPGFATSDLVSLLLFLALGGILWAVATERLLGSKPAA